MFIVIKKTIKSEYVKRAQLESLQYKYGKEFI